MHFAHNGANSFSFGNKMDFERKPFCRRMTFPPFTAGTSGIAMITARAMLTGRSRTTRITGSLPAPGPVSIPRAVFAAATIMAARPGSAPFIFGPTVLLAIGIGSRGLAGPLRDKIQIQDKILIHPFARLFRFLFHTVD
jgi:hypothetical protein